MMCASPLIARSAAFEGTNSPYDFSGANSSPAAAQAPTVTQISVLDITDSTAKFYAEVSPNGDTTTAYFLWGPLPNYPDSTAIVRIPKSVDSQAISSTIKGLSPATIYHYQVVAVNAAGSFTDSNEHEFVTPPVKPAIARLSVDLITQSSARLTVTITPNSTVSAISFLYGLSSVGNFQQTTVESLTVAGADTTYQAYLTGLNSNSTYYVEALAANTGGSMQSTPNVFSTLANTLEYQPDSYSVGLYHFDGTDTAHIEDYSLVELNGNTTAPIVSGKFGNGRRFDSGLEPAQVPDDGRFSFGSGSFTLEAWVNPSISTGTAPWNVVSKGSFSATTAAYFLRIFDDGTLDLELSSDGASNTFEVHSEGPVLKMNRWQHVAAVVDETNDLVFFYVNDQPVTTTLTGTFPDSVHTSTDPLMLGQGSSITAGDYLLLDEVRISNIARSQKDFTQDGGALFGSAFLDINNDRHKDALDPSIVGLTINLYQVEPLSLSESFVENTTTDSLGNYSFTGLANGVYSVRQKDSSDLIQDYPYPTNYYTVTVTGVSSIDGLDFGDVQGCLFLGGSVLDPGSWSCGHVPVSGSSIVIGGQGTTLAVFPTDSVFSYKVQDSATVNLNTDETIKIGGPYIIGNGATVTWGASSTGGFIDYSDWINNGVFIPGQSTIYFRGDAEKTIGGSGYSYGGGSSKSKMIAGVRRQNNNKIAGETPNAFYNLSIQGANTSTSGNISVQNALELDSSLWVRDVDTLIILSSDSGAISGSGEALNGNVRRNIQSGSTSRYRFESVGSFVQFQSGTNPTTVTEAALPESSSTPSLGLWWELIPTTVDTVNHTLSARNINHFSTWAVYKPGGGLSKLTGGPRKLTISGNGYVQPNPALLNPGDRMYRVLPSVEGTFNATVSFSYADSELSANPTADTLVRGPYVIDSVQQGWNMVSLPVTPEINVKDSLFPGNISISNAFSYSGGYIPNDTMQPGIGYWLKFGSPQLVSMLGFDIDTEIISLAAGWNMVGMISYATDTSGITTDPPGALAGSFFGYQKGYYPTTTFEPMQAYWIKTLMACQMQIAALPSGGKNAPKVSTVPAALKGLTQMVIKGSDGQTQTLFVGSSPTVNASRYEMPPLAPKGIFDARFATNSMVMVSPSKGFTETAVQFNSASYPVTIQWQAMTSTNGVVVVGGKEYSLASAGSAIVNNAQTSVSVKLGPAVVMPNKPRVFALYQNYPNPFNPSTTIRFDLAQDAPVTLKLYNILGQEVATLINNQPFAAGSYSRQFRLDNLSSGVYMYRISAGSYTAVRKMLLLK